MAEDPKTGWPDPGASDGPADKGTPHRPGPGAAGHAPRAPAPARADVADRGTDTYSVAGEEDPGAAVDPPAPGEPSTAAAAKAPPLPGQAVADRGRASPEKGRSASPDKLVDRAPRTPGSMPAEEAEDHLQLPHERDESAHMTGGEERSDMRQASTDLEQGMVDTDMRATPGLDADQRERYVKGPGGSPPGKGADKKGGA